MEKTDASDEVWNIVAVAITTLGAYAIGALVAMMFVFFALAERSISDVADGAIGYAGGVIGARALVPLLWKPFPRIPVAMTIVAVNVCAILSEAIAPSADLGKQLAGSALSIALTGLLIWQGEGLKRAA